MPMPWLGGQGVREKSPDCLYAGAIRRQLSRELPTLIAEYLKYNGIQQITTVIEGKRFLAHQDGRVP
jgi:hypothetical protein